ncbi:MAG TPA: NAD-dependent epimerase/dehydratase family protein, partial [Gemmatimonadaceae bacterium]|nr:NAD-dependent epimerase/dehydratase family protein [Gemmatimonadaceae bacterium]
GTRNVVAEAERAGVRKIVYVSSLGCERGESPYHRSKLAGEEIVRSFGGEWIVVRPGAVYGPGDEHLSVLLRMVRTLPAMPIIGDGNQPVQPLWHEDAAAAIAIAAERDDLNAGVYDLAGTELTSQRDLVDRMRRLTNRSSVDIPVPQLLAQFGIKAAGAVGVDLGFSDSQLQMLIEGSALPPDANNALTRVFGITPLSLDEGLRRLADVQPEQLPDDGIGPLTRKRFWADIADSRFDADRLLDYVRLNFSTLAPAIMSASAEPGTPSIVEEGVTLTLDLPLRGHVQVRVAEVDERRFTLMTLEGHPLAGAVRMQTEPVNGAVRFEVQVYDRAASIPDLVVMRTLGDTLQDRAWTLLIGNVVKASGGHATQVRRSAESLSESEAAVVQRWAEELVLMRKQHDAGV